MSTDISTRIAKGVPVALATGAASFFLVGPWAVEKLVQYGFSFEPTVAQQLAMLAGFLICLPACWIVEWEEAPRALLAVNGAVWGALLYLASMLLVFLGQKLRRR